MVVSLTFICTLFPFFYVVLGAAIKLTSTGPILFRQQRSGLGNKPFTCLKFRTMVVNDEADILQATDNDKRITSIGHFLRRTSLDELPQFINILKGDMSIIGPRPHMLYHTEIYSSCIPGVHETSVSQTRYYWISTNSRLPWRNPYAHRHGTAHKTRLVVYRTPII